MNTRDEVIAMARELGIEGVRMPEGNMEWVANRTCVLEKFATLVTTRALASLAGDVELPADIEAHIEVMSTSELRAFIRDYGDRRAAAERELIVRFLESHGVIAVGGSIADQIMARR